MFSVLVVPTILASSEYAALTPVEEIHPFKLLIIEEKLDELMKSISKTIKEIERSTAGCNKNIMNDKILKYAWNLSNIPLKNFPVLIEHIECQIVDIQKSIADHISKINEVKARKTKSTKEVKSGVKTEQFLFIDCLYCLIDWRSRKKFGRLFDPKILIFIKKLENKAAYKVYCLKNEIEDIKQKIRDVLKKNVEFVDEHLIETSKEKKKDEEDIVYSNGDNTKLISVNLMPLLGQCLELCLFVAVLRGFVEILNKYGLPPDFKYKIMKSGSVEKELKKLKRKSKEENIHDMVAIVDLPF
ncbi:uncharacterized protein VICG_00305 [Vittaforma corneae ATCC 50505]|uniref:V-type proton ATPase subunit C n=1 Tax=Vittaforma corneae (strain ATCC 50505) TaxID=993615 RepID=L2GNU1_VITCO|nr:uncharacterized protein VICG_00305 [Vittaforma corneae ATCC 50505]ELA42553.1 hypothetical protein VICG_00305 [Vittaforma corneae ATCC 50505]